MISAFFESVGEELSKTVTERLAGPAFLFWLGGLALAACRWKWECLWNGVVGLSVPLQAGLLVGALLVLVGSDALLARLSFPLLRWMEGYWPSPPLGWLRALLTRCQAKRQARTLADWQALQRKKAEGTLSARERYRLARRERQIAGMPPPDHLLPTSLGNLLCAAERRVAEKYGLDVVTCWPRLWLLLPDGSREAVGAARARLDRAAQGVGWGILFLAWSWVSPWAVLIALVWAGAAWWLSLRAAAVFATLVESAFDAHRWLLYEHAGWPRPPDSQREPEQGRLLSEFLARGTTQHQVIVYRQGE